MQSRNLGSLAVYESKNISFIHSNEFEEILPNSNWCLDHYNPMLLCNVQAISLKNTYCKYFP